MNRAARRLWLALALASLAASPLAAAEKEPPADQIKLIQAAQPGMVKVEYTLQYDKGQAPHSGGWVERCPNCGQIHSYSVEEYVGEERPLTTPGFLISPTQVAAPDILMHERFIKSIVVRAGGQSVPAKVQAYGLNQKAVILELASPPAQARPIAFEPAASGPYFGITMTRNQAEWVTRAAPWSPSVFVTDQQRRYVDTPANALIVDSRGVGAGMTMNEGAGVDDAWKGSPLQWPLIKTAELARLLSDTQQRVDRQVLRVTLNFRSPKNGENSGSAYYRSRSDEEAAVRQVFGVTVDARTVLVLAELKPKTTARLERIRVNPAEGEPVNATFAGTLSDYGAFLITLDKPLSLPASGALRELTETALLPLCDQLLPSAELSLQGETRIGYYRHRRISGIDVGWRQHLYPQIPDYPDSASPGPGGPPLLFVYDRDGRMLALPVSRRQKAGGEESYNSNSAILTNVAQLNQAIGEGPSALDPNNIPLSEAEENRVAWLGVELQPLTPELSRANKVPELTGDGQSGALVTYVYPDSPAAKAGVEAGYILLRLHVEGQPAPLEVRANDDNPWESGFPWDRLSEAPEAVFERIPSP